MKNISYLCKVKISIMKKFNSFYNDYSNPSVLGADKLYREWTCNSCNKTHNRDILAATNIKKFGLRASTLNVKTDH